jgi:hypothetical protein
MIWKNHCLNSNKRDKTHAYGAASAPYFLRHKFIGLDNA